MHIAIGIKRAVELQCSQAISDVTKRRDTTVITLRIAPAVGFKIAAIAA